MLWKVEFTETTDKRLDKPERECIRHYIREIEGLPNPSLHGEPLVENLANLWKYRVRKYRIICRL